LTSRLRVLVVEDHEPFRRVICELLQQRADLLIVGEAADGLDAICQAEALRPDVVMLDIGLPMLSGIEVAGRIRAKVPDAKLMFVTNESSLEVVEQAFRSGAHGYVYKPRVQRDVLPVLEAIIRGGRFVSGGLERIAQGDSPRLSSSRCGVTSAPTNLSTHLIASTIAAAAAAASPRRSRARTRFFRERRSPPTRRTSRQSCRSIARSVIVPARLARSRC
jgi:DNA-binding NarL/FixJ family response regulator